MITSVGGSWNGLFRRLFPLSLGRDAAGGRCVQCCPLHWGGRDSFVIQVLFSSFFHQSSTHTAAMPSTWRPEEAPGFSTRRGSWGCWRSGQSLTSSWLTCKVSFLSFGCYAQSRLANKSFAGKLKNSCWSFVANSLDFDRVIQKASSYTQASDFFRPREHEIVWTRISRGHRSQVRLSLR